MSSSPESSTQWPFRINPVWFHPVGLITAQNLIIFLLIGFTSARSIWRPILLPLIVGCACVVTYNSNKVVTGLSWTFVLQYIDLCLLSRWNFETGGPEVCGGKGLAVSDEKTLPQSPGMQCKPESSVPLASRMRFALDSTFGYRHIGTPQESKNTPHFDENDHDYVPSGRAFFAGQVMRIVRCYLVVDFINAVGHNRTWKNVEIFSRLHEISKEELMWRFIRVVGFWLTVQSVWTTIFALMSMIAVGLRLSEPRFWPPLFAAPSEAYSIRRFWGNTWHQILRRVLGKPVSFICHDILDIQDDFVARYIKLYLVFLISGLLHAAMDVGGGIPFEQQGSIRFLVSQALGIAAEDVVQAVYKRLRGKEEHHKETQLWIRIVGNVWTLAFLVWTTPAWFYPEANRRQMNPLQFSLFGLAKSYFMQSTR